MSGKIRAVSVTNVINGKTVFGAVLEIISKSLKDYISQSKKSVPKSVPKNVPLKRVDEVVNLIKKDKNITISQIASLLNVSDKTVKRDIAKLKKENKIVRVGGLKSGYWEVVDEN